VRIAIDCRYLRGRPSGIGSYLRALVDRLPADRYFDFTLWAHPRAPRRLSSAPNVSEIVVHAGPNSPLSLLWPGRTASFNGVDLVHFPHNVLPRGVPCRTVVTIQDVHALDSPRTHRPGFERVRGLYYPQAVRRALRDATRLIVTTHATADRVIAWEPRASRRLRVIALAADDVFRPAEDLTGVSERVRTLTRFDGPFALAVGEDTPHKGHASAIRAFAASAPASWRLVLVLRLGSGRTLRRAAEESGIAHRIVWLQGIGDEELASLMQTAAVLLQPSLYEGFGLPVVEAMACGCPVVASDIPALREVTGGAALLAAPGDAAAFADAIRRLGQSRAARQDLAARGLARAADFSWDRTAAATWDVYRDAARG
jgi:glycosyltransferase involved in cell wall biosynthesis